MSQYDNTVSGFYIADGNAKYLNIPFQPDFFELHVQGDASGSVWNATGASPVVKSAWWARGMAPGTALSVKNTASAATDQRVFVASDGVAPFTTDPTLLGPPLAISGITNASPPVVTVGSTAGLVTGDVVLLTGTTGALQLATLTYTITVINGTTFSLVNMGAPGSAATGGVARKVLFPSVYIPEVRNIVSITRGTTTTVQFSVNHGYHLDETLRFIVPSSFGMVEINGLKGKVLSIPNAASIVVDIDSSAFTAFVFISSAVASVGATFAQTAPIGQQSTLTQTNLSAAFQNTGTSGLMLGATIAGAAGNQVFWRATLSTKVYTS